MWWSDFYQDHAAVQTAMAFAHLGGLLVAGGLAIAADRTTIRASRRPMAERDGILAELHAVHRPVLAALTLVMASGALLFLADLDTYLRAPAFWVKMALIALLLANGALLGRTGESLRVGRIDAERGWRRLKASARASQGLWLVVTLLGVALVNLS